MNTCPRCSGQILGFHDDESCLQCGYVPTRPLRPIPTRFTRKQQLRRFLASHKRWYHRHLPDTRQRVKVRVQRFRRRKRYRASHERWYHSVRDHYRVKGERE